MTTDERDAVGADESQGKFVVELEPGNALQTPDDVAAALRDVADTVLALPTWWEGDGAILDRNGNSVGRWTFHDREGER
jgi:hypothetical protein